MWDQFLKIHAETLWQCDFFSKRILSRLGLPQTFAMVFLNLATRRIWISTCTLTHVGEHAHAMRQGFRKEDVIVSIAGQSQRMRESDVFSLLVNKPVGEKVFVTVLRGAEQVELSLVVQK